MTPNDEQQHAGPGDGARVVLRMRDISKSFGGVHALKGVQLDVHDGEVAALLGENGAGKSTLMNILAGVFGNYGGGIELDGTAVTLHSPKQAAALGIAMIHQELNLVPEMSIADNILLGREPRTARGTVDRKGMRARARELLAEVGLDVEPRRLIRQCRIAEQQLIEVAKALSVNVRVLVMDEPTSALADAEVQRLFGVIRTLTARGVAVIYISHRLEELEAIADSVTVLRDGSYVGRRDLKSTGRDELIAMMVGRPLGELYPRPEDTVEKDVQLRVSGLELVGDRSVNRASLHGIDLTVRAGEIVGIAGLMGSGRSEVLQSIYGSFAPHAVRGRFEIGGRRYRPRTPKYAISRGFALVAEDRKEQSLILDNTIRFNASLAALPRVTRLGAVSKRKERALVAAQAKQLQIKAPSVETTVANLSGGNQQKVVLAKCLLTSPQVVLLDEPTRGVDVGAKAEVYELMNQLAADGSALVMVSSELPELLATCDRIVVLCEGRITGEFSRAEATQERILDAAMDRSSALAPDVLEEIEQAEGPAHEH
ncbi:MAG: sugar ABC transporter ATP-binding protein [Jatrophihabitans sp.]